MKKILTIAAFAVVATIASATNVKWGLSSAIDTTKFADGSTVYLVQGTFSVPAEMPAEFTTAFLGTSYDTASLASGKSSKSVSLTTTDTGFDGNTPFYVAIISSDGKHLAYTASSNINVKDSALSSTFNKAATGFTILDAKAVPEPCSVALLAIGLAAFGLKRKVQM